MYQDNDNNTAVEAHMATDTSTIRPGAEIFTLINVFSVAPDHQEELAHLLIEATEHTMRHLPGFISANIHTSFDGRHVVNYAQWRSRDAFEAMLRNADARLWSAKMPRGRILADILQTGSHLTHSRFT